MAKTKQIVAFGMGAVVIGGIAWYLMTKRKEQRVSITPPMPMPMPGSTSKSPQVEVSYDNEITIRNAGGNGKYKWYTIKTGDRTKANAGLQIGTVGLVNGKEKCTINDFYNNDKGQITSFKCEEKEAGSYDIPNPSRFEY